jgi:hypothetical protein
MKDPPYQCLVAGLRIDLDGREVVFTETYTKSIENEPSAFRKMMGTRPPTNWKIIDLDDSPAAVA